MLIIFKLDRGVKMHPSTQGSCHSNCVDISCSGATCSLTYLSSSTPLQLFNVKKTNAAGETDRSENPSVVGEYGNGQYGHTIDGDNIRLLQI